jgi:hypothetical protein
VPTSESFRISGHRLIATGFDFEPLPSGEVLIQFFADDGKTINTLVITRNALARLPMVVHAFFLAVDVGQDAALAFLDSVTVLEGRNDAR